MSGTAPDILNSDLNTLISRWETKPCLSWPVVFYRMKSLPLPLRGALCSHQYTWSSLEQDPARLSNLPMLGHKYTALPGLGMALHEPTFQDPQDFNTVQTQKKLSACTESSLLSLGFQKLMSPKQNGRTSELSSMGDCPW